MTPQKAEDIPLLYPDPVIEAYLKDVDRTLLRSQLQRTATERVNSLWQMALLIDEGQRLRREALAAARARVS